jgi:hypothetical protein
VVFRKGGVEATLLFCRRLGMVAGWDAGRGLGVATEFECGVVVWWELDRGWSPWRGVVEWQCGGRAGARSGLKRRFGG